MTADEQNQARIEAQMKRIIEQSSTINRQAQTISDLYVLLGLRSTHSVLFRIKALRRTGALVETPTYSARTLAPARDVQVVVMYE